MPFRWIAAAVLIGLAGSAPAGAQTLTIDQAMHYAADHYPTVRAALEQVNASAATVDVARAAYLPRLDALWQSNRATANNVFGQLLPQAVIPAMSGPVLPFSSAESVWGTAGGALFSWEAVDFGLRRASVAGAEAALTRARAGETLTRLDVESAVGGSYLGVLAAERAVAAAQADVERREVLGRIVHTLVDNQLRPGADASRADAERAAARTRLIQAQQTRTVAQATLARLLGVASGNVTVVAGALLDRLPAAERTPSAAAAHPLTQAQQAAVDQARAFESVLARTDRPHVYLQSSVFARGSGANAFGPFEGGATGLGLDRANWAAGVQVVFPNVFDFSSLHARQAAAAATTRAEIARLDEAVLRVASQQQTAAAVVQAARDVASNTPLQLDAARVSETQARARYDAGLANLTEVAEAQSLLAQAEIQDQLARVDVWRAVLGAAVAQGDLTPFITLTRQP